jgi:hypothetical protein
MTATFGIETWPLFFFYANTITIDLSPIVRIRAITKTEKYPREDLSQPGYGWGLEHGYDTLFFAVDCLGRNEVETRDEVERLAVVLLLFKMDPVSSDQLPWFILGERGSSSDFPNATLPPLDYSDLEGISGKRADPWLRFVLLPGEEDEFRKSWIDGTKSPWPPSLRAAGRRLLRAQSRFGHYRDADRLIDLVIAFEALVIKKKEWSKQSKLASRIAALVGGSLSSRVHDDVDLAYDLRNDAVHDGDFDKPHLSRVHYPSLEGFLSELERHLRMSLRSYVAMNNKGLTKDQIISKL